MDLEEDDTTSRSILIGLGCTLLFHLLLVILSPQFSFQRFSGVHSGIHVTSANKGKTFDFELAQPATAPEKQQLNFMETNSAAPENTPTRRTTSAIATSRPRRRRPPRRRTRWVGPA